jgi:hypothetical protein
MVIAMPLPFTVGAEWEINTARRYAPIDQIDDVIHGSAPDSHSVNNMDFRSLWR